MLGIIPKWFLTRQQFKIPVEYSTMPRWAKTHKELSCSGYDLIWASFLSGRPVHLAPTVVTESERFYRHWRITSSLCSVVPDSSGYLKRASWFYKLDRTDKGVLNFSIASTFAKIFASEVLDAHWLAHLSLIINESSYHIDFVNKKRPDYIGLSTNGAYIVAEAKGRMTFQEARSVVQSARQKRAIANINNQPPAADIGVGVGISKAPSLFKIFAHDPTVQLDRMPSYKKFIEAYYADIEATLEENHPTLMFSTSSPDSELTQIEISLLSNSRECALKSIEQPSLYEEIYNTEASKIREEVNSSSDSRQFVSLMPDFTFITSDTNLSSARRNS